MDLETGKIGEIRAGDGEYVRPLVLWAVTWYMAWRGGMTSGWSMAD